MILRHVMEHLRKQEWTAVAIDFLIVVVGVFLAFRSTIGMRRRLIAGLSQRIFRNCRAICSALKGKFAIRLSSSSFKVVLRAMSST